MSVAPYFPNQDFPVLFAMSSDEPNLYYPEGTLTKKHQEEAQLVLDMMGMFQVGMLIVGKQTDSIAFYAEYKEQPWLDLLYWYHEQFSRLFADITPIENLSFFPRDSFYQDIAKNTSFDNIIICQTSYTNEVLHQSAQALKASQLAGSKMELAKHAAEFSIPVPKSFVCSKGELSSEKTAEFFAQHKDKVLLKISGMGGARNVAPVADQQAAIDYLEGFADDTPVLLQEKLDTSRYTEMTVDLLITDKGAEIDNVRDVLFCDGLWVGNHLNSEMSLTLKQEQTLLKVADFVRSFGYSNEYAINCGIDYFVCGEEILVTEINARWTGGMLASHLVKKLNLQATDAYAFFDHIAFEDIEKYKTFVAGNLYDATSKPFSVIPVGFSPYLQDIEEQKRMFVWMMVVGDFDAFVLAKDKVFGEKEISAANKIASILHHPK